MMKWNEESELACTRKLAVYLVTVCSLPNKSLITLKN